MAIARIFLFLSIVNFSLAPPVLVRQVHELRANVVDVAEEGTATSQNWWDDWLANAADQASVPTTPQFLDLGHLGLHNPRSNSVPSSSAMSTGPHPSSKGDFPKCSWKRRLSADNSPPPSPDNSRRSPTDHLNPSNPGDLWLSRLSSPNFPGNPPPRPDSLRSIPSLMTDNSHPLSPGHSSPSRLLEDSILPSSLGNSLPSPPDNSHLSNPNSDDVWLGWLSFPNSLPPSPVNPPPRTAPTTDNAHLSNPDDLWLSWLALPDSPPPTPPNLPPSTALTTDGSHLLNPDNHPPGPADNSHPSNPDYSWPSQLSAGNSFSPSSNSPSRLADNSHPSNPDDFWPSLLSADNYLPLSSGNSHPSGDSLPSPSSAGHSSLTPGPSLADHSVHSPPLNSLSIDYSGPDSWELNPPYSPTTPNSWKFSPPSSWSTDYSPPSSSESSTGHSSTSIDYSPPSSWSADHHPSLPSPLTSTSGHSSTSIDYSPPSSWSVDHPPSLPSPLTSTPGYSATNSLIEDKSQLASSWLPKYSPQSWSPTDHPLPGSESLSAPLESTYGYPPEPLDSVMSSSSSESLDFLDKLLRGKIRRRISDFGC